jgi:hypothetical protein
LVSGLLALISKTLGRAEADFSFCDRSRSSFVPDFLKRKRRKKKMISYFCIFTA